MHLRGLWGSVRYQNELGQHIRHLHPKLANERMMAAVKADIQRKRAARKTVTEEKPTKSKGNVYSHQEEVELMAMCEKYAGERHINEAIEKELKAKKKPQKEKAKQIYDKRRTMSIQAEKQVIKPEPKPQKQNTISVQGPWLTELCMKAIFRTAIQTGGSAMLVRESAEGLLRACGWDDPKVQVQATLSMIEESCKKHKKSPEGKTIKVAKGSKNHRRERRQNYGSRSRDPTSSFMKMTTRIYPNLYWMTKKETSNVTWIQKC